MSLGTILCAARRRAVMAGGVTYTDYIAGDWTTTGDSYGTGTITTSGNNDGGYASGVALTGDFSVTATISASGAFEAWGVFPVSEVGTWVGNHASGDGQMDLMTNSYHWSRGEGFHKGSSIVDATVPANSDALRIERIGSTLKAYINDVLQYTDASATTAGMYLAEAHANGSIADFSVVQYSA